MDVYVARQPIFDRTMNIFGYELLYRRSTNNFYEGIDDTQATAELINNSFLVMKFGDITNGSKAFINFSAELLESEVPLLLPKEKIVVEILERVDPTSSVIEACKKLKKNGYILALDDFVFNETYLPLIEIADIIKIEFSSIPYEQQQQLIKRFSSKVKFLAEKIETREDYHLAHQMGYELFQGYFFSKPTIVSGKEVVGLNTNLLSIINELNKEEPEYQYIAEVIERDLGLSYKLLRIANSIFFGTTNKIYSIKQAIVRLGLDELNKWVYLMMLSQTQNSENEELIKMCLIRGKLMELLAIEMGKKNAHLEFFMAGIFSSIDILLNQDMDEIVEGLPLMIDVKDALLGKDNELRQILNIILNYEMSNWNQIDEQTDYKNISGRLMPLYIESLNWAAALAI